MTRHLPLAASAFAVAVIGCGQKEEGYEPLPDSPPAIQAAPVTPAPDPRNTNFQPGGGAVQNVRQAARRTVAINDMHQLGLLIQQMQLLDGRMPDPAQVRESVRRDAPKIAAAIEEGTIILTGTRSQDGLWAYEVDAERQGGIGLVGGTAQRLSADQVQQLLVQR